MQPGLYGCLLFASTPNLENKNAAEGTPSNAKGQAWQRPGDEDPGYCVRHVEKVSLPFENIRNGGGVVV